MTNQPHDGLTIERLIKQVDEIRDRNAAEPEDLGGYQDAGSNPCVGVRL